MFYWEKQKKIKTLYEQYTRPVRLKYGLTQMEYSILMFLHRNPGCDTAASIVSTRQFTKSHVSAALKALEERGLVTKEYQGGNKKTVHLRLSGKAQYIIVDSADAGSRYISCLFTDFSEDEMRQIGDYFERICSNAEAELNALERGRKDA